MGTVQPWTGLNPIEVVAKHLFARISSSACVVPRYGARVAGFAASELWLNTDWHNENRMPMYALHRMPLSVTRAHTFDRGVQAWHL